MTFVQKKLLMYWSFLIGFYAVVALFGYRYGYAVPEEAYKISGYLMLGVMALSIFKQLQPIFNAIPNTVIAIIFAGMPLSVGNMIGAAGFESVRGMLGVAGLVFLVILITFIFWSAYLGVRSKTTAT